MALFEVMAALSASLAIAIPTFMEKVMRPKYEERFSEFTRARREVFFEEFEKASHQIKQTKDEMTPELMETMESLFNEWSQIKTDENKLTTLLKYRKLFFVGWLGVCFLCLLSIQHSEVLIPLTKDVTFGVLTWMFFGVMFLASISYGYDLFNLDEKLSKIKAKTTGETFGQVEPIRGVITAGIVAEGKVEDALKRFKIPFQRNAVIRTEDRRYYADFLIPTAKNPKYLIEVKTRLFSSRVYSTALQFREIKSQIPLKLILISNFKDASPDILEITKKYWDFAIDFEELENLREIIEL